MGLSHGLSARERHSRRGVDPSRHKPRNATNGLCAIPSIIGASARYHRPSHSPPTIPPPAPLGLPQTPARSPEPILTYGSVLPVACAGAVDTVCSWSDPYMSSMRPRFGRTADVQWLANIGTHPLPSVSGHPTSAAATPVPRGPPSRGRPVGDTVDRSGQATAVTTKADAEPGTARPPNECRQRPAAPADRPLCRGRPDRGASHPVDDVLWRPCPPLVVGGGHGGGGDGAGTVTSRHRDWWRTRRCGRCPRVEPAGLATHPARVHQRGRRARGAGGAVEPTPIA